MRDVADLPLQCLGACRCTISLGGLEAEQDVYFIPSAKSLFLSLSVCKRLGLVPASFPHHSQLAVQALAADGAAPEFGQPPVRPAVTPFPPHEEHVRRLEEWLLQYFSATIFNTTRNPLPVMEGEPHHIHLALNAVHPCLPHTGVCTEALGGQGEGPARRRHQAGRHQARPSRGIHRVVRPHGGGSQEVWPAVAHSGLPAP